MDPEVQLKTSKTASVAGDFSATQFSMSGLRPASRTGLITRTARH